LPAVALVGNQALEHGDRGFLSAVRRERDFAEERGYAREVGDLGKEAADFYIGVFRPAEAPEKLQDQFVAINDRCVGLFRGAHKGRQALGWVCGGECGGGAGTKAAWFCIWIAGVG